MASMETRTVTEAVAAWDRGESIFSVEMGGLGPGYEQVIQVLIVELLREYDGKELLPNGDERWRTWGDEVVSRLDEQFGYSGAQVGAAKNAAARMLRIGYHEALEEVRLMDPSRIIQVQRDFPRRRETVAATSTPEEHRPT